MPTRINLRQVDGHLPHKRQILVPITVPGGQNFVVLSSALFQTPPEPVNIGGVLNVGAVVASLPGSVGAHSLVNETGEITLTPKNLVRLRDGVTHNPILSSGREIYGFLQVSSLVVDGDIFDDESQISFVRQNINGNGFEACPISDIENLSINYEYYAFYIITTIDELFIMF